VIESTVPDALRCSLNVTFHFWGRPLLDALDGAVTAGFRTIELLDPYALELDELEGAIERRGLAVDVINLPMGDFYAGERGFAADPARRMEFQVGVEQAARVVDRLGIRKVNALAGIRVAGETESAQRRCLIEQLGWAAERLASSGARVTLELLNSVDTPGYLADSLDHVGSALAGLDGAVGFQLDLYHLRRAGYDLLHTIEAMADVTSHYQVADAPERTEPGSGDIDFRPVLQAIAATGYDGIVGCEYKPSRRGVDAFAWMDDFDVVRA
jgi:hydroxypyruvate isomerase